MRSDRDNQRGFTFSETLIAAAIGGGVVAVAGQTITTSVRLSLAAERNAEFTQEAEILAARLEGGMSDEKAIQGLDGGWTIERVPVPPLREGDPVILEEVTLKATEFNRETLSLWIETQPESFAP